MNILPKKRWHVRTKENIARVRKDEAEAAEKEKQEKLRIENADREARLSVLKHKSKQKLRESGIEDSFTSLPTEAPKHINLFEDLDHSVKTTNKAHDKEVKDTKEEYEKKIGYLTYLGQDTNEALKKKNWYEVMPETSRFGRTSDIKDTYEKLVLRDADGKVKVKESDEKNGEVSWKAKQRLDPFCKFRKITPDVKKSFKLTESVKPNNKHIEEPEGTKNNKANKLLKLREARLKRERQEKYKTEMFLRGQYTANEPETNTQSCTKVTPKYNSQFNPEIARQNYT